MILIARICIAFLRRQGWRPVLFLCLLLPAQAPAANPFSGASISATDLQFLLISKGVVPKTWFISDKSYELPTHEWTTKTFPRIYVNAAKELQVERWETERNDCDDLARLAVVVANSAHRKTSRLQAGAAIGMLVYQNNQEQHVINLLLVNNQGEAELLFFDACRGFVTLTPQELKSCVFVQM